MKHLYSLLLLLLLGVPLFAQITVTGKITDNKGESLPGVSVTLKGTTTGVISDADGAYSISAPADGTLVFSFIGFKSAEVSINSRTVLNTQLEEDLTSLDEVVVIGYGVQKKSVATASISKVDAKKLEGFSVQRVDQMLQGQVSGVIFKGSSGQPGSSQNIFIRGVGTNGNNNPLIIIDGLNANDGALAALNPADVESIQVLKDGASTAIYGARAANGIIMVTTKKAKAGEASFNYNFYYGWQQPWKVPQVLNSEQYIEAINEKYGNDGTTPQVGYPTFPTSTDGSTTNSKWMDKIFETSPTQTHNLSISKGSETGNFMASLSYFAQDGVIAPDKSNASRITGRVSFDQKINQFLAFGQQLNFVHATNERIGDNNVFGSPISEALVYDPITSYYDENGTYGFAQSHYVQKEYINPLSQIFITNNATAQDYFYGHTYLSITPMKGLTIKSDVGVDYNNYSGKGFSPNYTFYDTQGNQLPVMSAQNSVYEYSSKVFIWQWENYATYTKSIGKHNGEVTLGTTIRERSQKEFSASGGGIAPEVQFDPNYWYMNTLPDSLMQSGSRADEDEILVSGFGRLMYNYDEKYLATFTIRRDGSSKFGSNNRYGIFPSASVGWVVSRESFWNIKPVSFLKVRASYGVNGNDRIGNLRFLPLTGKLGVYPFGKPGAQTMYDAVANLASPNPDLQWEESKQLDIGFEAGLFNDQVTFEFDYYHKTTSGLLMAQTIPRMQGNNPPDGNVGEVVNKGIEIEINYRKNFGPVGFTAGMNVTTLKNEVTKVTEGGYVAGYTWPIRNSQITRMQVGDPIGYFRGYETSGIFKSLDDVFGHVNNDGDPLQPNAKPGDLRYVDVNNDGVINDSDITNIGKPWADVMLGLNLGATYRGFDVRILFAASIGNDIYRSFERQDVPLNNYTTEWLDRWSESNPNGSYPRLTAADPNGNSRASSFYVEDGSYLRLKNLQIGYSVPRKLLDKVALKNCRIYASFDNLLTLTGYSGFDPEIGTDGWILDTSIDKGYYPQLKTMGFGLNITF
jgi:TonB-dependent starch-binding outer membrane protein SusC